MTQSVNILSSAHTLQPIFSARCSNTIQCTHTATNLQCTLQQYYPVHTAANLQCTLQQYYPAHTHCNQSSVHTAAILSSAHTLQPIFSAHCSNTIQCTHTATNLQCTLQLHYLVPIPYSASSAPLDHHRVSLYHYCPTSRAVSRH